MSVKSNDLTEKSRFLLDYTIQVFKDEDARFTHLEGKAALYMGFITFIVGGYTAFLQYHSQSFFPPEGLLDWAINTVVFLSYLGLISTASQLFRSIRISEVPSSPIDESVFKLINDHDIEICYKQLARTFQTAVDDYKEPLEIKSKHLEVAYKDTIFSSLTIVFSCLLIVIDAFLK